MPDGPPSPSERTSPRDPAGGPSPAPEPRNPRFSLAYLDRSTEPSTDFYRFATGTWVRENPVPSDKSRWGAFDELLERNFHAIRSILEEAEAAPATSVHSVERQVGDFFASAMDTARLEQLHFGRIAHDLAQIDSISSVEELFRVLADLHRVGVDGGFESYVYPDKKASEVYAFYLEQGGLSLPDRDYYVTLSSRASSRRTGRTSSAASARSARPRSGRPGRPKPSSRSRPSSRGRAGPGPSSGTRTRTTTGSRWASSLGRILRSPGCSISPTGRSGPSPTSSSVSRSFSTRSTAR